MCTVSVQCAVTLGQLFQSLNALQKLLKACHHYLGTNKFLTKIYSELKACEICMKTTYRTKVIFLSRKKTFEQSERKVSVNKSNKGRFSAQSIIDMRIN